MTDPILRTRHSPGMTRRKATRDTSETGCESVSSVREVLRFLPLQRHLHAVCQRGASTKMRPTRKLALNFEMRRNSRKVHAISVLPMFNFQDSTTMDSGRCLCYSAQVLHPCRVGKNNREP